MTLRDRIDIALTYAFRFGGEESAESKAFIIDQMVRALHGGSSVYDKEGYECQKATMAYMHWKDDFQNEYGIDWNRGVKPDDE